MIYPGKPVVILSVLFQILVLLHCSEGCGRSSSRRPNPDRTKPTLKCPDDVQKLADDKQIFSTDVYWTEPQAQDNRDGPITPTRTGLGPGKVFYENTSIIRYSAKDRSGNYESCSFKVNVKVERCTRWESQSNGWRTCSPSHDMLRGTECRFGCNRGFELVGSSIVNCLMENSWSESKQPFCRPNTCPRLLEENDRTHITCTDQNNYRSVCYYSCISGFDILPGINRARVCSADGTWTGQAPTCRDVSPPVFTDCPAIKIGYAESLQTSGRIAWNMPKFTDNDGTGGVVMRQVSGPQIGQTLLVGEYTVRYEASDRENNTAACEFKVAMKQISCSSLFPKPYTYVSCPHGRHFGSICTFSCKNGTALNGPASVQCESFSHGDVRFGRWSFGETQPSCNLISSCDKPIPPNNGALVCDTWAGGKYCLIQCRHGYLIKHDFDNLLLCRDSTGTWNQLQENENLPDCNKATSFELVVLKIEFEGYFSFDGDCTNTSDEIRENFLNAIFGELGDICSKSGCSMDDTVVFCGNVTDRRKRAVASQVIIKTSIILEGNDNDAVSVMNSRSSILKKLQNEVGNLTIATSSGTANLQGVQMSQLVPQCPPGFYADIYSLTCVECMPGSYHDVVNDTCQKCPRGQYQPEHGQVNCERCSEGKTTERIGAEYPYECVDACPPGYFSATGVPPCSPCDMATYSSAYGTVECAICPGSKTTNTYAMMASTSVKDCFDFDIDFPGTEFDQQAAVSTQLENSVTAFQVGVWIQCHECNRIVQVTNANEDFYMDITHENHLSLNFNGCDISTNVVLNFDTTKWRYVLVSVDASKVTVQVDNDTAGESSICTNKAFTLPSFINVTIGGSGFLGRLSQLNIWIGSLSTPKTSACHDAPTGDLLSWRQFQDAEGAFTVTASECDADDNCLSNPCNGQGRCIDHMDTFACLCDNGFKGDTCQTNIDDCVSNSCENGATCQDGVAGYTCLCIRGYSGLFCETEVVDGAWAKWESWGPCSVTCGTGTYSRTRVCADPSPDNGGKYCGGDTTETAKCNMPEECHYECHEDPTVLEHGTLNCSWTDNTQTVRLCYPTCEQGYAFDSDLFLDEIVCGPQTGNTWNIRNDQNPKAQIPNCRVIGTANVNVLTYSAKYHDLTSEEAAAASSDVEELVQYSVKERVSEIESVKNGSCALKQINVTNVQDESAREKRELTPVGFVLEISCSPNSSIIECYNLLLDVKLQLDAIVNSTNAFAINVDQVIYKIENSSAYASGRTECELGTVPVDYFCINCGPGSYQYDLYCERCPLGSYQDTPGAVDGCKQCPKGWTTAGLQTKSKNECNVRLPDESRSGFVTIVVVSIVVIVCLTVTGIIMYLLVKRFYGKQVAKVDIMPDVNGTAFRNSNKKFAWHDFQPFTVNSESLFSEKVGTNKKPEASTT